MRARAGRAAPPCAAGAAPAPPAPAPAARAVMAMRPLLGCVRPASSCRQRGPARSGAPPPRLPLRAVPHTNKGAQLACCHVTSDTPRGLWLYVLHSRQRAVPRGCQEAARRASPGVRDACREGDDEVLAQVCPPRRGRERARLQQGGLAGAGAAVDQAHRVRGQRQVDVRQKWRLRTCARPAHVCMQHAVAPCMDARAHAQLAGRDGSEPRGAVRYAACRAHSMRPTLCDVCRLAERAGSCQAHDMQPHCFDPPARIGVSHQHDRPTLHGTMRGSSARA